mgnify:CR=1 FL=1
MRTHLQGIGILALVALSLWGLTQLAAPALSGDGSAVTAESREDRVDLTVGEVDDEPLTADEVLDLQFGLEVEGILTSSDDVDGLLGQRTRAAMADAATAWELDDPTDRQLYDHVVELLTANPFFGTR